MLQAQMHKFVQVNMFKGLLPVAPSERVEAENANAYQKKIDTQIAGTGEIAQQLRALAALREDQGSIPSTYMVSLNCLWLQRGRGRHGLHEFEASLDYRMHSEVLSHHPGP